MNKNLIIILAALILLIIPITVNASLLCEVTTNCQYTDVLHISALTNAHAEINTQTNYNQKICCRDTNGKTLGTICNQDSSNVLLHLSALTNAHVEKNSESSYTPKICLSATDYTILYTYSQDCSTYDTCITSLSTGNINLHLGDCNAYSTKLCASLTSTLPPYLIQLNRAYWSQTTTQEGEIINLVVEANSATIGKTARFTIEEDDGVLGSDLVNIQPQDVTFVSSGSESIATGSWVAEWQQDGLFGILGDPEYKFTAYVDNLQIASSEPKLTVSKSMPSCGNGIIDSGENCQTCPDDAGCGSGKLCCTSDATVDCKTSCINLPACDSDGVCDSTESCNCEDCNNEQSGCIDGDLCDSSTQYCACDTIGDGICTEDQDCKAVDPDCVIPPECTGCVADGVCKLDETDCRITNTDCNRDPDCGCDEYENYFGTTYSDCGEDQCDPSYWSARISCCESSCGAQECFSGWTCPEWSKCSNGFRTRGACTRTSLLPLGCDEINSDLTKEQKKACIETVKFPVYDNLNLLFSILILMGYYLVKKRF